MLRALGVPVQSLADIPSALRESRQEKWRRGLKPVAGVRDGEPAFLELRVTSAQTDSPADCTMVLENGEELHWTSDLAFLPALRSAVIEGVTYIVKGLYLPPGLPYGYHRLRINLRNRSCETLLIVAPRQAYTPNAEQNRLWGVFIPLYSLHSEKSWGAGNLTDLENLIRWVKEIGRASCRERVFSTV